MIRKGRSTRSYASNLAYDSVKIKSALLGVLIISVFLLSISGAAGYPPPPNGASPYPPPANGSYFIVFLYVVQALIPI